MNGTPLPSPVQGLRRDALALLSPGDGRPVQPTAYDRFEAWWYGAADNTRRAFVTDIRAWSVFQANRGQPPAPASALDVRDYVRLRGYQGAKASTIARALASIAILHDIVGAPSPVRDRVVSGEMKGLRRHEALAGTSRRRQAKALRLKGDVADLERDAAQPLSVLALLSTLDEHTPAGARDRLLLLLGADLGRRRSELTAFNVGDVVAAGDGSGTIVIRRSKTDQGGEGRVKYLSPAAMRAFERWLAHRAAQALDGAVAASAPLLTSVDRFGRIGGRLSDDGIRHLVRRIAREGLAQLCPEKSLEDIDREIAGLSGHSFRVGFAQDLTAAGEDFPSICQAADWKSPEMPSRYAEALSTRSGAVARLRRRVTAA